MDYLTTPMGTLIRFPTYDLDLTRRTAGSGRTSDDTLMPLELGIRLPLASLQGRDIGDLTPYLSFLRCNIEESDTV
jgi:hypothetical protein